MSPRPSFRWDKRWQYFARCFRGEEIVGEVSSTNGMWFGRVEKPSLKFEQTFQKPEQAMQYVERVVLQ